MTDKIQIKNILNNLNKPIIFKGFINNWPILNWSLNDWELKLQNKSLQFRKNYFYKSKEPIWEKACSIETMSFKDFIEFQTIDNNSWIYYDYKYMNIHFDEHKDILNTIQWADLGFPDKSGADSTIWIGSKGAHTPCHMDTYGFNLIAQIYGRKRWIMFPPEENLIPIRVPYEESSVYSKLNFFYPNTYDFQRVSNARSIILNPGDVLFLPVGWWHYVENLETAISINMWVPQPQDHKKRIEEAVSQLLISKLLNELDNTSKCSYLNSDNNINLINDSTSEYLKLMQLMIEQYKKENLHNKKIKADDCSENITKFTSFIQDQVILEVPMLAQNEFFNLLKNQQLKYNFVDKEIESNSNKNETIEKIINATCHPEVLSMIVDKLLKN